MSRLRCTALAAPIACLLAVSAAAVAAAATRNGVTPRRPPEGVAVAARGNPPTFVVRARGGGQVFVRVCRSAARRGDGLICAGEAVGRARRGRGGLYRFRPLRRDFPGSWLNRPGVYHWQVHRIRCERRRTKDCRQEGPVRSVTVR